MTSFNQLQHPVIPYLFLGSRGKRQPLQQLPEHAAVVFAGGGELTALPQLLMPFVNRKNAQRRIYLHVDFIDGISKDEAGLRALLAHVPVDGIISVRGPLIEAAHNLGLSAVLRIFLHDTRALEQGVALARRTRPDAVELMPAIAAAFTVEQLRVLNLPLIGAGLLTRQRDVETVLSHGFCAVSTSHHELW